MKLNDNKKLLEGCKGNGIYHDESMPAVNQRRYKGIGDVESVQLSCTLPYQYDLNRSGGTRVVGDIIVLITSTSFF